MPGKGASAEGVGLSYHPFLHEALLARRDAFDFIELPLDLYVDAAWSALLDSQGARLADIAAAKPCVWRGTALSLGSVERIGDPAPDPRLAQRIRDLIAATRATRCCEAIGFRRLGGRDLGQNQSLPYTETAARWIAARHAAACDAVGHPIMLQLSAGSIAPTPSGWDAAAFLHRIAGIADCRFVLDVADLGRFAAEAGSAPGQIASRLPGERITVLTTSGERDEEWALLSMLLARTAARAIVIRVPRNVFPFDRIMHAAQRASVMLADRQDRMPSIATPLDLPGPADPAELAALQAWQSERIAYSSDPAPSCVPPSLAEVPGPARAALAVAAQSWQNWRGRVEDMHKAQQIAQFLAQDAADARWHGG